MNANQGPGDPAGPTLEAGLMGPEVAGPPGAFYEDDVCPAVTVGAILEERRERQALRAALKQQRREARARLRRQVGGSSVGAPHGGPEAGGAQGLAGVGEVKPVFRVPPRKAPPDSAAVAKVLEGEHAQAAQVCGAQCAGTTT